MHLSLLISLLCLLLPLTTLKLFSSRLVNLQTCYHCMQRTNQKQVNPWEIPTIPHMAWLSWPLLSNCMPTANEGTPLWSTIAREESWNIAPLFRIEHFGSMLWKFAPPEISSISTNDSFILPVAQARSLGVAFNPSLASHSLGFPQQIVLALLLKSLPNPTLSPCLHQVILMSHLDDCNLLPPSHKASLSPTTASFQHGSQRNSNSHINQMQPLLWGKTVITWIPFRLEANIPTMTCEVLRFWLPMDSQSPLLSHLLSWQHHWPPDCSSNMEPSAP